MESNQFESAESQQANSSHPLPGLAVVWAVMTDSDPLPTAMMTDWDEDDDEPEILDISNSRLEDLTSVQFPQSLIELDLTANQLTELDSRIGGLSSLRRLFCGKNLLGDFGVEPISGWVALSFLSELVLSENQLNKIPDVSKFKNLLVFDVSINEISSLNGLSKVSVKLEELYASKNKVLKIEEIEHLHDLQLIDLGSNKLQVMENLQNLTHLEELWLGQNFIRTVNLCGLKCIKKLSLQSNLLTSMTGLEECVALEELYLSHNGIAQMEGLSNLGHLRILDVSSNKLTTINAIGKLSQLEDLWLNNNQISSLEGIAEAVAGSRETLTTIYLACNPCANTPSYITTLRQIFPNIQQVDSEMFP